MAVAFNLHVLVVRFCFLLQVLFDKLNHIFKSKKQTFVVPKSVNYHFTRKCNYECGFCFHTAKSSFVLPLEEAKKGLKLLKDEGMEKINFSGGEPFIHDNGNYVGALVTFCKLDLKLPSVTIVSNGSLVGKHWFKHYGKHLDILAISCDSFNEETNQQIGRGSGKNHVRKLYKIRDWCKEYQVAFKINTVVNTFNKEEDMAAQIQDLDPVRWKVFQCLLLEGENAGPEALRNAEPFYISDQEFDVFLKQHANVSCMVPESNTKMKNSYLILDEKMRFLDCRENKKVPSKSILDVGVNAALNHSGFDEQMFIERGGVYVWSKDDLLRKKELEW